MTTLVPPHRQTSPAARTRGQPAQIPERTGSDTHAPTKLHPHQEAPKLGHHPRRMAHRPACPCTSGASKLAVPRSQTDAYRAAGLEHTRDRPYGSTPPSPAFVGDPEWRTEIPFKQATRKTGAQVWDKGSGDFRSGAQSGDPVRGSGRAFQVRAQVPRGAKGRDFSSGAQGPRIGKGLRSGIQVRDSGSGGSGKGSGRGIRSGVSGLGFGLGLSSGLYRSGLGRGSRSGLRSGSGVGLRSGQVPGFRVRAQVGIGRGIQVGIRSGDFRSGGSGWAHGVRGLKAPG